VTGAVISSSTPAANVRCRRDQTSDDMMAVTATCETTGCLSNDMFAVMGQLREPGRPHQAVARAPIMHIMLS
jgi:hypothetical protein